MKFLMFLAFFNLIVHSQDSGSFVLKTGRDAFREKLHREIIEQNLKLPLTDSTEEKWITAFWGLELGLVKSPFIEEKLSSAFNDFNSRSIEFRRSLLEAVYALYPAEFYSRIEKLLSTEYNEKLFAMEVNYLIRSDKDTISYLRILAEKFGRAPDHPILKSLIHQLKGDLYPASGIPPLRDLFTLFARGHHVLFSLQRCNRDYPGILLIRKPDGKFYRNSCSDIFSIPQLARSISSLPGYITNGNTPQGVYSVQSFDTSMNIFIGTTPNIQTVLPYEIDSVDYFHKKMKDTFIEEYKLLLPDSWKDFIPAYETYLAGSAGRTEIICHGTTVDPEFYHGRPYYPNTPTLGCLSALEIWSEKNGELLYSDQKKLYEAMTTADFVKGYLFVININDKPGAVVIDEIILDILRAEEQAENH